MPKRGRGASRRGLDELAVLGLQRGEAVRWQETTGRRWRQGEVVCRERDGSLGVVDARGAARSLPVERVQVRCLGPRGGRAWEPLVVRAGRSEQLRLL